MIEAAHSFIEGKDSVYARALVTQTWELLLDGFPYPYPYMYGPGFVPMAANALWYGSYFNGEIQIPLAPLQSVDFIKYYDPEGALQTLDVADYNVDNVSTPGWVLPGLNGWPSTLFGPNTVTIRFKAGYSPNTNSPPDLVANVPRVIKLAMKMLISHWYEHREPVAEATSRGFLNSQEIPFTVQRLLEPYKVYL